MEYLYAFTSADFHRTSLITPVFNNVFSESFIVLDFVYLSTAVFFIGLSLGFLFFQGEWMTTQNNVSTSCFYECFYNGMTQDLKVEKVRK